MSGTNPLPPSVGGAGGFMGGWRAVAALGGLGVLGAGAWWLLGSLTASDPPPPPRPSSPPGVIGSEFPVLPPRPAPVAATTTPAFPVVAGPPRPVRRPRPSAMALYDDPEPLRAPERPRPAAASGEPQGEFRLAGMRTLRAEVIPEPEWWLMPGDKIACENLEPMTARTGAPWSATVPFDVRGRTGNHTLIPRGSRVFGTVAKGIEHGEMRLAAVLSHAETPAVPGRPAIIVPLGDAPAADVIGQVDLEGNVETHFWSRLAGVAAYAGLDLISTAGGTIAGAALADAMRGATGGRGGGIGIYSIQGAGRSLAGAEYQRQMSRPPTFERPQGQPCSVVVNKPLDFRIMKAYAR